MLQSNNKNSKNNNNSHLNMNNISINLWLRFILVNTLRYVTSFDRHKALGRILLLWTACSTGESQPDEKVVWKKQGGIQFPAFMKTATNKCLRAFGMISSGGFHSQLLRDQWMQQRQEDGRSSPPQLPSCIFFCVTDWVFT